MDHIERIRTAIAEGKEDLARDMIGAHIRTHPSEDLFYLAAEVAPTDLLRQKFLRKAAAFNQSNRKIKEEPQALTGKRQSQETSINERFPTADKIKQSRERSGYTPPPAHPANSRPRSDLHPVASFGRRFAAYTIDSIIGSIGCLIIVVVFALVFPPPLAADYRVLLKLCSFDGE